MKKFLSLLMMTVLCVASGFAATETFDFSFDVMGSDGWSSSYAAHTVTGTIANVTFASADKNAQTITDIPVTKGGNVTAVLNDMSAYKITGVKLVCRQWGSKAQTITLNTSDDGTTFTATATQSSNFTLEAAGLDTKAVRFTFSSTSNQVGIESLEITYVKLNSDALAAPTILLNGKAPKAKYTLDELPLTLTIISNNGTENPKLVYSFMSNPDQAQSGIVSSATINIGDRQALDAKVGSNTLYVMEMVGSGETYQESLWASATFTIPAEVATIAEFNALEDNTELTFNGNLTVVGQTGSYLYAQDAEKGMLIYGSNQPTYSFGDIIPAGFTGNKTTFKGAPEMTSPAGLQAATENVAPTAIEITPEQVNLDNVFRYAVIKGATVSGNTITVGEATTTLYDRFEVTAPTDGATYDIYGVVGYYNNPQFMPLEYVAVQEPAEEVTLTITPDATGNVYDAPVEVTIACSDPDAIVTYKLGENGAEQDYTEPFTIYESTTVYAYAVSENAADIIEASMAYTINLAPIAVTFTPAAGTYEGTQNVKVAIANTYGDVVATYYLNNEEVQYNDETGIEVAQSATIKVEVMDEYHADVAEFTAEYVITEPQPVDPTLTTATIVFDNYDADATASITSDELMKYITEGADYVASADDINKVYKGKTGLKFSSSSVNGAMTLNFAEAFTNVTKVEVEAMAWLNTSGVQADATAAINGQAVNTELATYEIMGETESLESLTLSATKRVYVKSITITYKNEETPEPAKNVIAYTVPENCEMTVATADGAPIVSGETEVEEGTQVVITVTPAEGYQVKSVTVTKDEVNVTPSDDPYGGEFGAPRRADSLDDAFVEVTAGENGAYTFVMPNVPVTIDVTMEEESPVTAISDINAANAGTVKYVNAQGQVSNRPFQGVNIVIDGNKTYKIVK